MPPAELAVRAPTPRDAAGIAEVLNAHAAATGRPGDETGERVERWFELEDLDPARDMFLAVEGWKIVGYADVSAPGAERDVVNVDLRVPPGRGRIVERLLEEVERRADELGDAGACIRAPANERDDDYRAAVAGFRSSGAPSPWRSTSRDAYRTARLARGLTSRRSEGRRGAVYAASEEAFADHWGFVPESFADWCTWNLGPSQDTSLWRLVQVGHEIAALCDERPVAGRGPDARLGRRSRGPTAVAPSRPRRGAPARELRAVPPIGRPRAGLGVDARTRPVPSPSTKVSACARRPVGHVGAGA